jgi:Tol biopolymer transport system component
MSLCVTLGVAAEPGTGLFDGRDDIGAPKQAGAAAYDASTDSYTIGGGGANMWARTDSFHYVWKKVEGDIALSADVNFVGQSAEPHRKACIVIRQTLAPDSAYVDAALHGDGLTSLQFRETAGDLTHEIQTTVVGPHRLRLEKSGDFIYLSLAGSEGVLQPSGCSVRLPFKGSFYIGLGVCAHNAEAFERAVFSHVQFSAPAHEGSEIRSALETITIASGDRRCVYHSEKRIAAPNWAHDGSALYFNEGGRIFRFPLSYPKASASDHVSHPPLSDAEPELIDTGFALKCTDDHGLSPDGSTLAVTDRTKTFQSRIYILPANGGVPKEITPRASSDFHGWSPDGQTLVFSAMREGKAGFFSIPAAGGQETRLTDTGGINEGPEYSADDQWIYFNSDRSGLSQIWKMKPDGSNPEQVIKDEFNDRFAHPSPDGKWIAFLSYGSGVRGAPADREVLLRLFSIATGETKTLAKLYGGDGTINAPSWSPDSLKLAYVRYQPKQ